jgi:acylphosphatase
VSIRSHVFYTGQVQGVGFRWTSQSIARRFPVGGWVRNLPDGRVEMIVEGADSDVEGYLDAVSRHFGRMIHQRQVTPETPQGMEEGFEITGTWGAP